MKRWCEQHDTLVPLQAGALQLADLAAQQACPMDILLRKTKLFAEDLQCPSTQLSPAQLAQLYRNASVLISRADLPLLLGQQLLPSGLQQHGIGLVYATTVEQALNYLLESQSLWSPLVCLQGLPSSHHWHLYFCDGGADLDPLEFRLAVISVMEALRAVLLWLGPTLDDRLWQFELCAMAEAELAECQSRWARSKLIRNSSRWCVSLPKSILAQPLPQASMSLFEFSQQQVAAVPIGFIGFIQRRLLQDVRHMPSLEGLADEMGISPATLKRKFKSHGSSYQKQVDQVRCLISDHYQQKMGYDTEQVAQLLNFYDTSNLRRAMKRWILAS